MRQKTSEAVIGKWPGVLAQLGVDEKFLTGRHSPCPGCGGTDRFRFDNAEGKGTWICSQCGAGGGFKLLEMVHGWDFREAAKRIDEVVGNVESTTIKRRTDAAPRLKRIYRGTVDICEVPSVEQYLTNRGLVQIPTTLRAHPALDYWSEGKKVGKYPALVATILSPEGEGLSLHCTYTENGQKLQGHDPRKIMPPKSPLNCGAAVRLFPETEVMGIAEGIETAIAAFQIHGIPTWSVLNTNGIKAFTPPEVCKRLVIFADHDHNFAGQAAAYELGRRLHGKTEIQITMPDQPGTDWADCL